MGFEGGRGEGAGGKDGMGEGREDVGWGRREERRKEKRRKDGLGGAARGVVHHRTQPSRSRR